MARSARRLRTELIIPPHADVSNAVGAVAGGVMQRVAITITQPTEGVFRAHLPNGLKDFIDLETAAAFARDVAGEAGGAMAKKAGAVDIETLQSRARRQGL